MYSERDYLSRGPTNLNAFYAKGYILGRDFRHIADMWGELNYEMRSGFSWQPFWSGSILEGSWDRGVTTKCIIGEPPC